MCFLLIWIDYINMVWYGDGKSQILGLILVTHPHIILYIAHVLSSVDAVQYLPRAISDHFPLLLTLAMGRSHGYTLSRLSPLWLKGDCFERSSATPITEFWTDKKGEVPLSVTCNAFKATLRGSTSESIRKLRSDRAWKI